MMRIIKAILSTAVAVAVTALIVTWPAESRAEEFVKFGKLVGKVRGNTHPGWTKEISWAPLMPDGQECTIEQEKCLFHNDNKIMVHVRDRDLSRLQRKEIYAGAHFDQVIIEEYYGSPGGANAYTITLKGVRVMQVRFEGNKNSKGVLVKYDDQLQNMMIDEGAFMKAFERKRLKSKNKPEP